MKEKKVNKEGIKDYLCIRHSGPYWASVDYAKWPSTNTNDEPLLCSFFLLIETMNDKERIKIAILYYGKRQVDETRPFVNDLSKTIADVMHVCDPFYPNISIDNDRDNRYSRSNSNDHLSSNST